MELKPEVIERIEKLEKKYQAMGQDIVSYLDGLLHADYPNYWNYIQLDTLLSLQNPKTEFPDESIFIIYHQVSELYFKLILHELNQVNSYAKITVKYLLHKVNRINRIVNHLVSSFEIMIDGMEKEQFLKFRMTLLPGSGFQSAQYRMIELASTNSLQLTEESYRMQVDSRRNQLEESAVYENLYWRKGATELSTGKKTLTLQQFEDKYSAQFLSKIRTSKNANLYGRFIELGLVGRNNNELVEALKTYDVNFNINWSLAHYKSAVRYLQKDPVDIAATGGTNWQKFLPPRFQRIIFFPDLWTKEELVGWGKKWVENTLR